MEAELRYYYELDKYDKLITILKKFDTLEYEGCFYEMTIQYDHPMQENSFYKKEIDGRFRVRCSKNINTEESKSKISLKRRTKNTFSELVNKEEVELDFKFEQLELKPENAYRLSWDDKYTELCRQQNIESYNHVRVGLPMPKVME